MILTRNKDNPVLILHLLSIRGPFGCSGKIFLVYNIISGLSGTLFEVEGGTVDLVSVMTCFSLKQHMETKWPNLFHFS